MIGNCSLESEVVEEVTMAVNRRVHDDGRFGGCHGFDQRRQIECESIVQAQNDFNEVGMRWIRHFTVDGIQREQDIGNMDRRGKRCCLVWIIVRESAAADDRVIAADMQVVDVLDEISYEEEGIDLVLMFGGLSKVVLLVSAGFQCCRIVLAEVPGAERGLSERLLCRERIVDDSVCSGESTIQAGHSVRRIERA